MENIDNKLNELLTFGESEFIEDAHIFKNDKGEYYFGYENTRNKYIQYVKLKSDNDDFKLFVSAESVLQIDEKDTDKRNELLKKKEEVLKEYESDDLNPDIYVDFNASENLIPISCSFEGIIKKTGKNISMKNIKDTFESLAEKSLKCVANFNDKEDFEFDDEEMTFDMD